MAEQNIKLLIHKDFFFFQIWMMYEPAFQNNYCLYPFATPETWGPVEFGKTKIQGKNLCRWVTGFYLPNTKKIFNWCDITMAYCRAEHTVSQFRLPEEFQKLKHEELKFPMYSEKSENKKLLIGTIYKKCKTVHE